MIGGLGTPSFERFIELCCVAFNALRHHSNTILQLFTLMLSTGIEQLTDPEDLSFVRNALVLDKTDEEASAHFRQLVFESLNTVRTQINNAIHILAHPQK